ncbi:hypothetical protein Bhyg_04228, partial [Pseudolycoriella hygida]
HRLSTSYYLPSPTKGRTNSDESDPPIDFPEYRHTDTTDSIPCHIITTLDKYMTMLTRPYH